MLKTNNPKTSARWQTGQKGWAVNWVFLISQLGRELINVRRLGCKVRCTPNSDQTFCSAANDAKCQTPTLCLSFE